MLADTYEPGMFLPERFHVQPKLDGMRVVIHSTTGEIWSRPGVGKDEGIKQYMPHITEAVKKLGLGAEMWLDGELYAHGYTFQEIMKFIRSHIESERQKLSFMLFDCVCPLEFAARLKIIENIGKVAKGKDIKHVQTVQTFWIERSELEFYHSKMVEFKFEGLMIRLPGAKYLTGVRTPTLLKRKDSKEMTARVVGFNQQKDGAQILGSFKCVGDNGVEFDARPKGKDKERKQYWMMQKDYLGKLVDVEYKEISKSGKPREPRVKRFRPDLD